MSAQIPSTIRAFTVDEGHKGSVKKIPTPTLGDNDVLIKVAFAAQNPTDWKHVAEHSPPGAITGGDLSGTIVALGPNLKTQWRIGDRVAGTIHGNLYPEQGAFAEYARAQSDLIFGVPDQITMEQAATFGVAWVTALQAIVESQGRPWPGSVKVPGSPWYLVYGGSTAVGLFAIQILRKIGYRVVAVAGAKNHDLVRSYGAHEVVDYKDPEAAFQRIVEITKGGVDIGLDTISEGKSYEISVRSFKEGGGRLNAILWPTEEDKKIRPDVEIVSTLMYTLFGKPFKTYGLTYDAIPTDHIFGKECARRTPDLIINYGIKPTPVELRGGLDDVAAGLEYQKAGKVSAAKLVYRIGA